MISLNNRGFERAQQLLMRHAQDANRLVEFELLGLSWQAFPGVFCPALTPVTGLFTSWLIYPAGGSFLEIGSGCGVTAVWAALQGCKVVTALDINPVAVQNTRANAARHGVLEKVAALESDLFTALPAKAKFDLIYWNSNFAEPPPGHVNETGMDHALFDPGYTAHQNYLSQAPHYLTPEGRLFLGFSDLGNWSRLSEVASSVGLAPTIYRTEQRHLESSIEFQLIEFIARGYLSPGRMTGETT